jgi:hypothetical protein
MWKELWVQIFRLGDRRAFVLFGPSERKKVLRRAIVLWGEWLSSSGIRAGIDSLFSIAEKKGGLHHATQKRKTVTRPRRQGGEKKR